MHTKGIMLVPTSAWPWKNGWLESIIRDGLTRWWSSLSTTPETCRILGGMTVVTFSPSNIWEESVVLLNDYPASSSGYQHESGGLLSAFWQNTDQHQRTSSYKSVIHSFANLDDIAVSHSPTLRVLRQECRRQLGED